MIIRYGIKPWEARMLRRDTYHWLNPIQTCISAIENGG